MTLWFFLLACGGLGFSIKLLLEHFKQIEEINDGIRAGERACQDAEAETLAEEAEAATVKTELEQAKKELGENQSKAAELTARINKRKEALANRGKFRV